MSYISRAALFDRLKRIFTKPLQPVRLDISNFRQEKMIDNDCYNGISNNRIIIKFYDNNKDNRYVGFITYRINNGQIGLFSIEETYQNRGLGKQILLQTIEDMKKNNITEIWAVALQGHPFWSNVFNKSFQWYEENQLHPSVRGHGYKMKI